MPTPDAAWKNPKYTSKGAVKYLLDYHEVKYYEPVTNLRPSYKPPPICKAVEALDKALFHTTRSFHLYASLFTRIAYTTTLFVREAG